MTEKQKQLKIAFVKQYQSKYLKQETYSGDFAYMENGKPAKMISNIPFEAELEYIDYERGRSALNTVWRDEKNKIDYSASMNLLHFAVRCNKIKNSKIKGTFQFYKQGTAILLEAVELL